ncbi:hypothetical protein KGV52_00185 [Candidatus Gracilibacteria bacterium]|nr:hypothetical protein [Candidatus Gracilibacteria bacterium]
MKKIIIALCFIGSIIPSVYPNELSKSCDIEFTRSSVMFDVVHDEKYNTDVQNKKISNFVGCKNGEKIKVLDMYLKSFENIDYLFEYNGYIYHNNKKILKIFTGKPEGTYFFRRQNISKYGNHIFILRGNGESGMDIKSAKKNSVAYGGKYIDGIKVGSDVEFFINSSGKEDYKLVDTPLSDSYIQNILQQNDGYFKTPYNEKTRTFSKIFLGFTNYHGYFLSEKTRLKLDKAVKIFSSKKENIAKIPTILELAGKIQKKYKKDTRNYEILDYLQAELKIIELKAKAKK